MFFSTSSFESDGGDAPRDTPRIAPFGSWKSPISAGMLVEGSIRVGDTALDRGISYWIESRPEEEGRCVIVRQAPGDSAEDVLSAPFSARSTAHEYGGGAFTVADGTVFFCNYQDQRIYQVRPGDTPRPVTPESSRRYADLVYDAPRQRLIAVSEDHGHGGQEPKNEIVAVALDNGGDITPLVSGSDFFSSPQVHPDGSALAWLSWNHPHMPWDGTRLWRAPIQVDGSLGEPNCIAGGDEESIFQPTWSPDGNLFFVSDRSNWWNLYRCEAESGKAVPLTDMQAEFGTPQWVFGLSTYALASPGLIVARYSRNGQHVLVSVDTRTGEMTPYKLPFLEFSGIRADGTCALLHVGAVASSVCLIRLELSSGNFTVLRRSMPQEPDPEYTSLPTAIQFPTTDGVTSHAFYYPPVNRGYQGPADEAPPLLVIIHGGPTSATSTAFARRVQFWTSRGFAVCDVNYGGSTGYGREYRNRLRGHWGIVDVADAVQAAQYLAEQGKADRKQLIIRGGSAGGYTTLAALAFHDVFAAGASYYGISDLALMTEDTHKFESRYLDQLVGPYPQDKELYQQRSPVHHLDQFLCPVIFFQGLEDRVVPPNQAERIVDALKERGVPTAYVTFEGEQHGFRKAENIVRCHEAELYFYGRILGFQPADRIDPVDIFGLPRP